MRNTYGIRFLLPVMRKGVILRPGRLGGARAGAPQSCHRWNTTFYFDTLPFILHPDTDKTARNTHMHTPKSFTCHEPHNSNVAFYFHKFHFILYRHISNKTTPGLLMGTPHNDTHMAPFLLVNQCSNNMRDIQTALNRLNPCQTTLKANKNWILLPS